MCFLLLHINDSVVNKSRSSLQTEVLEETNFSPVNVVQKEKGREGRRGGKERGGWGGQEQGGWGEEISLRHPIQQSMCVAYFNL